MGTVPVSAVLRVDALLMQKAKFIPTDLGESRPFADLSHLSGYSVSEANKSVVIILLFILRTFFSQVTYLYIMWYVPL